MMLVVNSFGLGQEGWHPVAQAAGGVLVAAVPATGPQLRKDLGNFFHDGKKSRYTNKKFPLKNLFP
jgi:hypothetical protein